MGLIPSCLFGDGNPSSSAINHAYSEEQLRDKSTKTLKELIEGMGLDASGCRTKQHLVQLAWLGEYTEETRPLAAPEPTQGESYAVESKKLEEMGVGVGTEDVGLEFETPGQEDGGSGSVTLSIPTAADKAEAQNERTVHMIQAQCRMLGPSLDIASAKVDSDEVWADSCDLLDLIEKACQTSPSVLLPLYGSYTDLDKKLRAFAAEMKLVQSASAENPNLERLKLICRRDLQWAKASSTLHAAML